jgi:hypothetical protein
MHGLFTKKKSRTLSHLQTECCGPGRFSYVHGRYHTANPGIVNLDSAMMNLLKLYFPTEVGVKQRAVERQRLEESILYGGGPGCIIV